MFKCRVSPLSLFLLVVKPITVHKDGLLVSVIESVSAAPQRGREAALLMFVVSAEFVVQWFEARGCEKRE